MDQISKRNENFHIIAPITPQISKTRRSINIINATPASNPNGTPVVSKPTPQELLDSRKQLSSHKAQVIANQVTQLRLPSHRVKMKQNQSIGGGNRRASFIPEPDFGDAINESPFDLNVSFAGLSIGAFMADSGPRNSANSFNTTGTPLVTPVNRSSMNSSFMFDAIGSPQVPSYQQQRASAVLNTSSTLSFGGDSKSHHVSQYTNMIKSTSLLKSASKLPTTLDLSGLDTPNHTSVYLPTPTNSQSCFPDEHSPKNPPQYQQLGVFRNPYTALPVEESCFATPASQLLGEIDLPLYYLAPTHDIFPATRSKLIMYHETHAITQHSVWAKNQSLLVGAAATFFPLQHQQEQAQSPLSILSQETAKLQVELNHMQQEIDAINFMLTQVKKDNNGKLPKQYKDSQKNAERLGEEMKKHEKRRQKEIKRLAELETKEISKRATSLKDGKTTPLPSLFSAQSASVHRVTNLPSATGIPPTNSFAISTRPIPQSTTSTNPTTTGGRKTSLFRFSKAKESPTPPINDGNPIFAQAHPFEKSQGNNRKKSKVGALLGFSDPAESTGRPVTVTSTMPSVFSPRTTTAAQTVASNTVLDTVLTHPLTLHYFYLMLEKECSLENLSFWKDVTLLYALFTDLCALREEELENKQQSLSITLFYMTQYFYYTAALIFEEYVSYGATTQVNLPDRITTQLEKTICELGEANQVINGKIEYHGYRLVAEIEEAELEKIHQSRMTLQQHRPTLFACVEEGNEDQNQLQDGDPETDDSAYHHLMLTSLADGLNRGTDCLNNDLINSSFRSISPQDQKTILDGEMQTAFILSVIDVNFDQEQGQYLETIMECYLAAAAEIQALMARDSFMRFKKDQLWTQMVCDCSRNNLSSLFFPVVRPTPALARNIANFFKNRIQQQTDRVSSSSAPLPKVGFASPRKTNAAASGFASPRKTLNMLSPRKTPSMLSPRKANRGFGPTPATPKQLKPSTQQQQQQQHQQQQRQVAPYRTVKIHRKNRSSFVPSSVLDGAPSASTSEISSSSTSFCSDMISPSNTLASLTPPATSCPVSDQIPCNPVKLTTNHDGELPPFPTMTLNSIKPHLRIDTIRTGGNGTEILSSTSPAICPLAPLSPIINNQPQQYSTPMKQSSGVVIPIAPLSPFVSPRIKSSFGMGMVQLSPAKSGFNNKRLPPASGALPTSIFAPQIQTPRLLSPSYRKEHVPSFKSEFKNELQPPQFITTTSASGFMATPTKTVTTNLPTVRTRTRNGFPISSTRTSTRYSFGRNSPQLPKPPVLTFAQLSFGDVTGSSSDQAPQSNGTDGIHGPETTRVQPLDDLDDTILPLPDALDDFLPDLPVPTNTNTTQPNQQDDDDNDTHSIQLQHIRNLQVQARQQLFAPKLGFGAFVPPSPQRVPQPPAPCRVGPFYSPSVTMIRRHDEIDIDFDILDPMIDDPLLDDPHHTPYQMSDQSGATTPTHNDTSVDLSETVHVVNGEGHFHFSPTVARIGTATLITQAIKQLDSINSPDSSLPFPPSPQILNTNTITTVPQSDLSAPHIESHRLPTANSEGERIGRVYDQMKLRLQQRQRLSAFKAPGVRQTQQFRAALEQAHHEQGNGSLLSTYQTQNNNDDEVISTILRNSTSLRYDSFTAPPPPPKRNLVPQHLNNSSLGLESQLLSSPSVSPSSLSDLQIVNTKSNNDDDHGPILKSPLISRFTLFKNRMKTSQAANAAGSSVISGKYSEENIKAKWFGE